MTLPVPLSKNYSKANVRSSDTEDHRRKAAFALGFAKVLDLYGDAEKPDLNFEYKGKDLASLTPAEALGSDWVALMDVVLGEYQDCRCPISSSPANGDDAPCH